MYLTLGAPYLLSHRKQHLQRAALPDTLMSDLNTTTDGTWLQSGPVQVRR